MGGALVRGPTVPRDSNGMPVLDEIRYNNVSYLTVTADFTSATWNTVASHELFTVTGDVRVRVIAKSTGAGTGATATAKLGIAGGLTWIAATTITDMAANEWWYDTTPTTTQDTTATVMFDKLIANGQDIGYEIETAAATGGGVIFHCWWQPISSDGAVVVGAGGTL